MTDLVWVALGMTLGAAVLHGALALRRPVDTTYLSFACAMTAVTAFLYFENHLYSAVTVKEAIEAVRGRELMAHALIASLLVFLPVYTRTRVPCYLMVPYWIVLALLIVANLTSPYTIWYSGEPTLVRAVFLGSPYSALVGPPPSAMQYIYEAYQLALFMLAFILAVRQIRRGERLRGITLAVAAIVVLAHDAVDMVRELVGGSWPYMAELGFASWGLIMSVQLALDFRIHAMQLAKAIDQEAAQAARLTAILGAMEALDRNMHAPLRTLQTGLAALGDHTDDRDLDRLRRAVTRLGQLAAER